MAAPVKLIFDLALFRQGGASAEGDLVVTPGDLLGMARDPLGTARLLWARHEEVVILPRERLPHSAMRGAALVVASLARAPRLVVDRGGSRAPVGRLRLLTKGLWGFGIGLAGEAVRGMWMERVARRVAARDHRLPPRPNAARSVAYVRGEPTLSWMGSYVGGAATHTSGVINGLVANGVDVRVYASETLPDVPHARVLEVPVQRVYHVARWLTSIDYAGELVRAASGSAADFVYARYALGSYAGLELARRLAVPFVLEFNGSEIWIERNWGETSLWGARTLGAIEDRNLVDASLIVVVSDVLREQLVEQGISPARIFVNPNGVDVERLAPLRGRDPTAWRRALDRPDAPTIGFIGTFGLWHGVKVLPAMVEAVAAERPDARWIVVGDGQLRAEVERELRDRGVADRVELTGLLPHGRALELLAASDVCVSPHVHNPDGTRFFGSPTKLFEYMGLGRAIVASDLEQIGEVLEDGRTGILCPPGDACAAAAAVVRLLDDNALRDRLGAAALQAAERDYSWGAHVRRIVERLQQPASGAVPEQVGRS